MDRLTFANRAQVVSFRQIQLMIQLHRDITSVYVVQSLVFNGVGASISILYVLVKAVMAEDMSIHWPIKVMDAQGLMAFSILIMVTFRYFGNVYKVSSEGQMLLRKTKRNRELRAFFMSCPTQRIYFGTSNFFESTTCLNIELFILNQTASLLLLNR